MDNNFFQQQLIQQVLLEDGIINSDDLKKAEIIQEKNKTNQDHSVFSYYVNLENYSLIVKNTVSGIITNEIKLPVRKKNEPIFNQDEWFPIGSNGVTIFSDHECEEIGEQMWDSNEIIGLTVGDGFSYLEFANAQKHQYFPYLNNLQHSAVPANSINSLPIDIIKTLNDKFLYLVDRGAGTLFIFDRHKNKLAGVSHLRQPGNKKTINIAATADGKRIYATDNETPSLFTISAKNLKIKKQALPYGNLCNIYCDQNWLYILIDKLNDQPELIVLDNKNLILRATIKLTGNLFSSMDDPMDLICMSPSGKFLLVMTYINYPALFTPLINIIDTTSFQLVNQIILREEMKPSYIAFAMEKPEVLSKADSGIIDILLAEKIISEANIQKAIRKIENANKPTHEISQPVVENNENSGFSFVEDSIDETEKQKEASEESAKKYPILSQYELDPSLLLAFQEKQMHYFGFVPVNKIDGTLTLAVSKSEYKDNLKQIIEAKFPDLIVQTIDFSVTEFNNFMVEFYSVIKDKYENIIANQVEKEALQENRLEIENAKSNQEKPIEPENKLPEVGKPIEEKSGSNDQVEEENQLIKPNSETNNNVDKPKPIRAKPKQILPQNFTPPRSDLPPNTAANIPADVRLAVREKLKELDPTMIEEAIIAICLEDFNSIWGIEAPKEAISQHKALLERIRHEVLSQDYSMVKIEKVVGGFSLETVVNQEKVVVMLKTLVEIAQGKTPPKKEIIDSPNISSAQPKIEEQKKSNCQDCNEEIPPEIDICSKCARKKAHNEKNEDKRYPSSPDPLSNLKENHILVSDAQRNRVIEVNPTGKIVWQILNRSKDPSKSLFPYGVSRLSSGTTLVTDSENDRVIEFTKSGRVYWELKDRPGFRDLYLRRPVQALRIINGNTLVVDQGNHRVFEVNHLDKIVWQYGITSSVGVNDSRLYSPSYVQRLSNGNTLITDTDNHRVIEINQDDKIVWQYGNSKNKLGSGYGVGRDQLNSPMQADQLSNGNYLIVDTGNSRVLEINRDKQVIWHFLTNSGGNVSIQPLKSYRLKNTNTVILSLDQMIEVNSQGNLISMRQMEYLEKSSELKERNLSEEEEKIVEKQLNKMSNEKVRQASENYLKNTAKLSMIQVPLLDRSSNKLFIANRHKNVVWRFGDATDSEANLQRPQYAHLIKDEYVILADTDNHRVIKIYRPTKEIVWQYGITGAMGSGNNQLGYPRSANLTPEGNILITDQYSCRILEINMDKEIVWSFGGWETKKSVLNAPYYSERLLDGHTLITDWSNHTVIEIDQDENIVWKYGKERSPSKEAGHLMYPEKATRIPNGNTLIADTRNNRVLEVDSTGKVVWEFFNYKVGITSRKISNPTNVIYLDNGNRLIIHNSNKSILEVDMSSEVVWQYNLYVERK